MTKVGDTHNEQTVVGHIEKDRWLVSCECGYTRPMQGWHFRNRIRRCKKCSCKENYAKGRKVRQELLNRRPPGDVGRTCLIGQYRHRAKKEKIPWTISREEFFALTQTVCHYCGRLPNSVIRPTSGVTPERAEFNSYTYNGVDRKIPVLGYVQNNCVSCCSVCNYAKGSLIYEEFQLWVDTVARHWRGF